MKAPTCSTRLQCQEAQNQNLSCLHYRLLTKIVPSRPFADIVLFQTSVRMSGCGGSPEHVLDGEETAAAIHGGGQQESGPGISLSPFLLFLLFPPSFSVDHSPFSTYISPCRRRRGSGRAAWARRSRRWSARPRSASSPPGTESARNGSCFRHKYSSLLILL